MIDPDKAHALDSLMRSIADEQIYARFVEVAIAEGDQLFHRAYGVRFGEVQEGRRMWELHCLSKPIVAGAVIKVAHEAGFGVDEPVAALGGSLSTLDSRASIRSLVGHSSGVVGPSGIEWICTAPADRPAKTAIAQLQGGGHAYAETAAGIVLDRVVTALSGQTLEQSVSRLILVPAQAAGDFVLEPEDAVRIPANDLVVPLSGLPVSAVPLLHVHNAEYRRRCSAVFGGFSTAPALARSLRWILEDHGVGLLEGGRPVAFDETWSREVGFRGPFVVERYDGAGEALFALAGVSPSFCYVGPEGSVLVAMFDGMDARPEDALLIRSAIVRAVFDD